MPAVSGLYVYPIKSCTGIALNEARLLPSGLEYDRNWLVCTPSGQMLTQRSHGRLALIQVALGESELIVSARGMPELRTPLAAEALEQPERFDVTVWRDTMPAFDTGPQTAAWFSAFLGEPVRLARFDPAVQRVVDPDWTGDMQAITHFADGFPLLVIGEGSLADLNRRLAGKGAPPIPMNRFSTPMKKTSWTASRSGRGRVRCRFDSSSRARAARCPRSIRRAEYPIRSGRTSRSTR
jgi:uncharacterized protein YcbX